MGPEGLLRCLQEPTTDACPEPYETIIIMYHHEFRPGWPVSVSAVISSSSLLSGRPGRRLPFG
jgi:hypothetical protein